jgi:hypothetical protein
MKAAMQGPAPVGRTRWRRFGVAAIGGFGAVAIIGYLAATGALALSFAFSGIPFTLSADSLTGKGFVQYAYPDRLASGGGANALNAGAGKLINGSGTINNTATVGGNTYASDTVSQFRSATIAGLAQQICAPTPLGNAIRVTLAGTGSDTTASDLVIQAPALTADSAAFKNIIIGASVKDSLNRQGFQPNSDFTDPYGALSGSPIGDSFGQGADTATLTKVNQIGIGTEAGSFNISGLKLYAEFVSSC